MGYFCVETVYSQAPLYEWKGSTRLKYVYGFIREVVVIVGFCVEYRVECVVYVCCMCVCACVGGRGI